MTELELANSTIKDLADLLNQLIAESGTTVASRKAIAEIRRTAKMVLERKGL